MINKWKTASRKLSPHFTLLIHTSSTPHSLQELLHSLNHPDCHSHTVTAATHSFPSCLLHSNTPQFPHHHSHHLIPVSGPLHTPHHHMLQLNIVLLTLSLFSFFSPSTPSFLLLHYSFLLPPPTPVYTTYTTESGKSRKYKQNGAYQWRRGKSRMYYWVRPPLWRHVMSHMMKSRL